MPNTRRNPGIDEARIQQFMAITGADAATAWHFLESCTGDVNLAVAMFLESAESNAAPGTKGAAKRKRDQSPANSNENASGPDSDNVRAPIPQKTEVLAQAVHQDVGRSRDSRELFPPPSGLLFQGTFAMACEAAKEADRWLITTVNNVMEFDCQVVNRDIWSNSAIRNLIQQRFILWQTYSDTKAGEQYKVFYKITGWPHIAIIDPRTGEKVFSWQKVDADSFYETASDFLVHFPFPSTSDPDHRPAKRAKTDERSTVDTTAGASHLLDTSGPGSHSQTQQGTSDDITAVNHPQTDNVGTDAHSDVTATDGNDTQEGGQQDEGWKDYYGNDNDPMVTIVFRGPDNLRRQISLPNSSTLMALVSYMTSLGFSQSLYELVALYPPRTISQLNLSLTLADAGFITREILHIQERKI